MKPLKTKAQMRAELEQAIAEYQTVGGEAQEIPRGLSGNPHNVNLFAQQSFSGKPSESRTPVTDVVKAVEGRKHSGFQSRPKKPRRVLLKDDFGEPLRWVWEDQT